MIAESTLPDSVCEDSENLLQNRELAMEVIKKKLLKAQDRMKYFADKKRADRQFQVGDMAYLKLHSTLHAHLTQSP